MPDFAHLHCHSSYSFLDGAAKVTELAKNAKKMGMEAIALTDHGYMHGLPEFYQACQKEGVKPIIGIELYMVDDVARVKEEKESTRYHQIILAKNNKGLDNLNKLASWAATTGYYYKPLIDFKRLKKYSEGLITTSSCMQSMISQAIIKGDMERAESMSRWFKKTFGDDFYFEVHDHGIDAETTVRQGVKELAQKLDIKVICANDVHYVKPEDQKIQVELMTVRMKRNKAKEYSHSGLHMATPNEMAKVFYGEFPNSLENTMEVVDKIDVTMPFGREPVLPKFPVPEGYDSEVAYLYYLAKDNIPEYYPQDMHQEALDRLQHEIEIINDMGYNRYFLIVQNITSAARELGIRVGPGRGSAAGSITSYLLGITNTDPLRYDLIFERFLNPERVTMPDIDIDFADHRRDELIDWIVDEYGDRSVSQIVTFGTLGTKMAIRDMCRSIGFSVAETNQIADLVPSGPGDGEERLQDFLDNEELNKQAQEDERIKELFDIVPRVRGLKRQTGVHACGILITPGEVDDYMPIRLSKSKGRKVITTQYEGSYTEDFGLLKMDILGLSTLSVIDKTIELVEENHGVDIDMQDIPLDDPATWNLFQEGETVCVFQFESQGMQNYMQQLVPDSIDDLVAMTALYRPGPIKLIPNYIDRKHGREEVNYFHEDVEDILSDTHGIMVFQEQIMKVAQRVAGFSLGEADILRRAVGKKKRKLLNQQKQKFVEGCVANGNSEEKAVEIFGLIEKFADYGFNRSHAAAYSEISYQTMYLKANYPAEFMAANLDVYANDKDKKPKYLAECRRMNIRVEPPNVNQSGHDFTAHYGDHDNMKIFYGLSPVKHVSDKSANDIISSRKEHGPYTSLADFLDRHQASPDSAVNSRVIKSLIKVGAMDSLPINETGEVHLPIKKSPSRTRTAMIEVLNKYDNYFRKLRNHRRGTRVSNPNPPTVDSIKHPKVTYDQKLGWEIDFLGDYVSGHPMQGLDPVNEYMQHITGVAPNSEKKMPHRKGVYLYTGFIKEVDIRKTKSGRNEGKERADIKILTSDSVKELNIWHNTYKKIKAFIKEGNRICVFAKKWSPDGGRTFVPIEQVVPIQEIITDWVRKVVVQTDDQHALESVLDLFENAGIGRQELVVSFNNEVYYKKGVRITQSLVQKLDDKNVSLHLR